MEGQRGWDGKEVTGEGWGNGSRVSLRGLYWLDMKQMQSLRQELEVRARMLMSLFDPCPRISSSLAAQMGVRF